MWDPVSVFIIGWIMNIGLPPGRLEVSEVIKANQNTTINEVQLREGL